MVIEDNTGISCYSINAVVDGMRYHKKTRYIESSKDEVFAKISNETQEIIDQFTVNFD